jgi:hypothetical protein
MSDLTPSKTPPQFRTAEYSGEAGGDRCRFCNQTLTGSYFRVNRSMACAACAEQVKLKIPQDNHAAFTRGLLFGAGGAIGGLILYAVVGIITGWVIGYVALAVGWLVGRAMMMGSGGIGGRRYQIAAVLLTYAAVSLAAVPIGIAQASKAHKAARQEQSQTVRSPGEQSSENSAPVPEQNPAAPKPAASFGAELVGPDRVGLALPRFARPFPRINRVGDSFRGDELCLEDDSGSVNPNLRAVQDVRPLGATSGFRLAPCPPSSFHRRNSAQDARESSRLERWSARIATLWSIPRPWSKSPRKHGSWKIRVSCWTPASAGRRP